MKAKLHYKKTLFSTLMGQSVCWLCNSLIGLSVIPEEHYTVRLSKYISKYTYGYCNISIGNERFLEFIFYDRNRFFDQWFPAFAHKIVTMVYCIHWKSAPLFSDMFKWFSKSELFWYSELIDGKSLSRLSDNHFY